MPYANYWVTRKQLLKMRKALEYIRELYETVTDKDGDFSLDFEIDDLERSLADFPDAFRDLVSIIENIKAQKI